MRKRLLRIWNDFKRSTVPWESINLERVNYINCSRVHITKSCHLTKDSTLHCIALNIAGLAWSCFLLTILVLRSRQMILSRCSRVFFLSLCLAGLHLISDKFLRSQAEAITLKSSAKPTRPTQSGNVVIELDFSPIDLPNTRGGQIVPNSGS